MTLELNAVPTISVLMCCYNAARWLDEAIDSVLNQTFTDFEFIIVDDGSVDNTLEIIHKYANSDRRIIVISKPNTGPGDSRNVGIKKALGKWIAVIDADDVCEPTRLERQVELGSRNPNLVFIGTGLTIIDDNGKIIKSYGYPCDHLSLVKHLRSARRFPPHSSAFYRKDMVCALGGFRLKISRAEDWDLWLRLSEVGELACLSEPLVRIRKHSEQISHSEGGRRQIVDSRLAMVSYWLRRYQMSDPVDAGKRDYEIFSAWIQLRLKEDGLFEFQAYKADLQSLIGHKLASLSNIVRIIMRCVERPFFTLRFIQERLKGESLTQRLALEWIEKTKVC